MTFAYDADGNLISKTDGTSTWQYFYNDENRLVSSTGPDGTTEYQYGGLGNLTAVTKNGIIKHYLIDPSGLGNVVGEYDDTGKLITRYDHGLGLLSKDDNYYTFDGNGNTSELTDYTDKIVNAYGYEPFGKMLYSSETVENSFKFVGRLGVRQVDNDLIYMRNRFYSPSLGRFMSEDPLGLAGGDVSLYRYVGNNPVNFVDPWGLFSLSSLKPTKSTVRSAVNLGTAFGYGALATALTGNPAAGVVTYGFVQFVLAKQLNQPHGIPIPVKYNLDLGIDWLNPSSLNENEPTHNSISPGENCD